MMILSPVIIFKSWANLVRTQYIIPRGYDIIYILSVIMGAVSNLILNALLIPKYQGIGAIIGTIIAEFVVCFIQTWKTRDGIDFIPYLKEGMAFACIGVIMYVIMQCVRAQLPPSQLFLTLLICFFIGTVVYCLLSVFYLARIKKDTVILSEIQRKIRRVVKFRKGN